MQCVIISKYGKFLGCLSELHFDFLMGLISVDCCTEYTRISDLTVSKNWCLSTRDKSLNAVLCGFPVILLQCVVGVTDGLTELLCHKPVISCTVTTGCKQLVSA